MAQSVGIDWTLDVGGADGETERTPERVLANRPGAAAIGRKPARIAVCQPQAAQLGKHWLGQRHAALLVAFANDAEHSFGVLDNADLNLGRLADAQATGIHQFKARPVDRIAYRSQDGADLRMGEHGRQALLSRRANAFFWENRGQSRTDKGERMFSLVEDLELLRRKIIEIGDVVMVQIDPMSAYLGVKKIDSFRTTDVRAVLAPLVQLASELKIAVLGILHFNKKLDVTNALLRISDSLAFGATARHVYACIDDAEHGRKLLVKGKNNLARREQKALAYTFAEKAVGKDPVTGNTIVAAHLVWQPEYVDVTATEAMAAANENKSPGVREDARSFLLDFLGNGRKSKEEVEDARKAFCIAERTLRRAKEELPVRLYREGSFKSGTWFWELPPTIVEALTWAPILAKSPAKPPMLAKERELANMGVSMSRFSLYISALVPCWPTSLPWPTWERVGQHGQHG